MTTMIEQLTQWFQHYQSSIAWIGILSAGMFIFSLLMLPWLLCKIPEDYFSRPQTKSSWTLLLTPRNLLRNTLGLPVLLAGVLMLVLPGQGLITIMLGLAIMQFPGKFTLERWVISRQGVLSAVNWIRRKSGVPELKL